MSSILTEDKAYKICMKYEIPIPEYQLIQNLEEALCSAAQIGYPVVAKIVSPSIYHKSAVDGVKLGIKTEYELSEAYHSLIQVARREGIKDAKIMIQKQAPPGLEVMIGATTDPQFGKVVMLGSGGVYAELYEDVTFRLAPISRNDGEEMLSELSLYKAFQGFRSLGPYDKEAVVDLLLKVSRLVTENGEIDQLDLNPVIIYGNGACAVDVKGILSRRIESEAQQPNVRNIRYLFEPRSVAVIGASGTPGKIGFEVLKSMLIHGYKGRVYAVNPSKKQVCGLKCYSSVEEIPDTVDLAVFIISPEFIPETLERCGKKGVKAAIVISGGFKERGVKGEEAERRLVASARRYGVRVIGPNCMGVFDGFSRLDTFFQPSERMGRPARGPVAFITQSGTFGCTILDWAAEQGIGISRFVSYGNRSDVDEADILQFLAEDSKTKVIAMYIEGFGDGRKLFNTARRITPLKPIVALKAGRTALGSKAAMSHTGWLAGSYRVAKSALKQAGIIEAEDIQQLFDMVKALVRQPLPRGDKIALITNGAGPCVMASDEIARLGLKLAIPRRETLNELKRMLPRYCQITGEIVDLTGSATSKDYEIAMDLLLSDDNVDVLMVFFVFADAPLDENIIEIVPKMMKHGKPIIGCASGGVYARRMSSTLESNGIPVYETPERAVAATYALVKQSMMSRRLQGKDPGTAYWNVS